MRRVVVLFALVLGLAVPVIAQPAQPAQPPQPATDPAGPPAPGSRMRQPEMLQHKPSGFRLPNVQAQGGAYRWGLMGVGGGTMAITAFFTIRYLRRVRRRQPVTSATSGPASSGSSTAGS